MQNICNWNNMARAFRICTYYVCWACRTFIRKQVGKHLSSNQQIFNLRKMYLEKYAYVLQICRSSQLLFTIVKRDLIEKLLLILYGRHINITLVFFYLYILLYVLIWWWAWLLPFLNSNWTVVTNATGIKLYEL